MLFNSQNSAALILLRVDGEGIIRGDRGLDSGVAVTGLDLVLQSRYRDPLITSFRTRLEFHMLESSFYAEIT